MRRRTAGAVAALLCLPMMLTGCIASGLPEGTREEKISTLQRTLDRYWADATAQDPKVSDLVGRGVVIVPDAEFEPRMIACLGGLGFEAIPMDGGFTYESPAATTVPPENLHALCFGRIISESQLAAMPSPRDIARAWAHQVYVTMPCLEREGYRLRPMPPLGTVLEHPEADWTVVDALYREVVDAPNVDAALRKCPPNLVRPGRGDEP